MHILLGDMNKVLRGASNFVIIYVFFLNQFTPSNAITPPRSKGLLVAKKKEKVLERTGHPILNMEQGMNLLFKEQVEV